MADVIAYREAILATLRTLPGITVYDGYVPEKVPMDSAGYILPYIVFHGGVGDEIPERDLSGQADLGGLSWEFQTTSVAAGPNIAALVANDARRALTNLPLGTYHVLPDPNGMRQQSPIRDTTITPARFFLPAPWRLDTT